MRDDHQPDDFETDNNDAYTDDYTDERTAKRSGLLVSRGFYMVLAICLLAVGGVAAATFVDTRDVAPPEPTPTATAPSQTATTMPTRAPTTTKAAPVAAPTADAETTTTAEQTKALFILPLSNDMLAPFSDQPVFNETMGDYRVHTAIDFGGPENAPVRALAKGTVTEVGEDPTWGHFVVIDHGGALSSRYCGVTSALQPDDTVDVGDEVGQLSGVPCESLMKPHLHLELYREGKPIDPASMLGGQVDLKEE